MKMEWLSFDEADARCDERLSSYFEGEYDTVLLVDGDLSIEGDLTEATLRSMAPEGDSEATLIAIQGDLTVQGRIALYDAQPSLYVSGHTRAETLEGGDCEIQISSGTFDYFILGYYNDGILATGRVEVPFVINYDHDLSVSAEDAVTIDNYGDDDDYDFGSSNIAESFVPAVLAEDDENMVCTSSLYEHLKAGNNPLREGAMTAEQAALAEIERARGTRSERLDMPRAPGQPSSPRRKLKRFPMAVCEMPWLKALNLSHHQISEIPPELGALTELEELIVDSCGLASLPDAIGELRKLRVLSVADNFTYDFTPEWLGSDEALALTKAGVSAFKRPIVLPARLDGLEALEELDVSGLSADLPKAQGKTHADLTPYPLPESVGRLTRLRKVSARRTNLRFPESMQGNESVQELVLRGLTELPTGLRALSGLRVLDARDNFLTELPAELCALGAPEGSLTCLERIDLRHNALLRADQERLAERFPDAQIELDGQEVRSEDSVEVYRLLDEANAQCSRGTLEGAIESLGAYERAFSASDERPDAQLYCLYRTAWVAANFVSMNYEREESHARALAASEKALSLALRREGRAYECLRAFSEPYGAIAGPLIHRETVRFCGHYVARDYLSTSSGPDDVRLEEALEFIERAVAYIDENNHYATMLPFTQVRVLMKMGRMKEAFRITRDLDLSHPDFPHLKDIKAGEAYTSWLASEG